MLIAIDVFYRDDKGFSSGILFETWSAKNAVAEITATIDKVSPYIPGQFYLRELPCIEAILSRVDTPLSGIIIDGYVVLGPEERPGLGMELYRRLDPKTPIIGLAKSAFHGVPDKMKLFRGSSTRPLYVSAAGVGLDEAKACIACMAGNHRIPDLVQRADALCKVLGKS